MCAFPTPNLCSASMWARPSQLHRTALYKARTARNLSKRSTNGQNKLFYLSRPRFGVIELIPFLHFSFFPMQKYLLWFTTTRMARLSFMELKRMIRFVMHSLTSDHFSDRYPGVPFYCRRKGMGKGGVVRGSNLMNTSASSTWLFTRWKLHLRPEYLPLPPGFTTKLLPPLVTVDKTFEDLFSYVLKNVRAFISKVIGDDKFWSVLSSSMVVVLTTPNGWEGQQQNRMRNAAIKAGLVSTAHKDRLRFVSEGEVRFGCLMDKKWTLWWPFSDRLRCITA